MKEKEKKFKKGNIVKVEKIGYNSSDFNDHRLCGPCGVYEFSNWNLLLFEITGQINLWVGIDKAAWCYELKLCGREQNFRAFVYEEGLKLISEGEDVKNENGKKCLIIV